MATAIDLVVDTSALTAILLGEPEAADLLTALAAAATIGLCAPNRTEFLLVIQSRLGDVGVERAKRLLAMQRIETVPLDEALADAAALRFRRFGKGRHPAGLNFGDCFSYALAIREQVPLLFKGNDFSQTDVRVAAYPMP
ncbi:type II toxin-antitoxin system VapC family toxin [Candidatus Thiodictyon syntrophicum]|jgi:ribonuclease VapC|uniref:type II toxin-antitoxin system VapC family toxin n=1 Tax=Candidatus Thiodictyon syntrophicum TaxID=1166950 RepID=UPI001C12AB59|nr:type II toxin-antitoxin system VapC family toxin [Candidatus Thiodictyon syntrophicum]